MPKPLLQWTQPRAVVRTVEKQGGKKTRVQKDIAALINMLLLVALWYTAGMKVSVNVMLVLTLLAGAFYRYGIPWLYYIAPSQISVGQTGISRQLGDKHQVWLYKNITECVISTLKIEGAKFRVLILLPLEVVLGIADSVSIERLETTLYDRGLKTRRIEHFAEKSNSDKH